MDPAFRQIFNRSFSPRLYDRMRSLLHARLSPDFHFRLAETPVFLPDWLRQRCVRVAEEVTAELARPEVIERCRAAIPPELHVPGRDPLPHCLAIDLAVAEGPNGELVPKVIELQGFASLYSFQLVQSEVWADIVAELDGMPASWTALFGALSRDEYVALLRRTVLGDCHPDEVVLLDLRPVAQKTRPDFVATYELLGIDAVCATEVIREGRRLYRRRGRRLLPIRRIYHRVVFDELKRIGTQLPFDYRDALEVTWVPHPNWYWIWSKYSMPWLRHPSLPETHLLSDLAQWPEDLHDYVVKPLFSFAGQGVLIDPTVPDLDQIPAHVRSEWIIQRRVRFAPVLPTHAGHGVKVEMRMMFLRPDDEPALRLAVNLCRLSRGKMHGVDWNKDLDWVGSSVAIWPTG